MKEIREITPLELRDLRADVTLVDVREPWEAELCSIEGGILVPLRTLPQRTGDIPLDKPVALYCHHGMRSLSAAQWLAGQGYETLSLRGGIDAWAQQLDPTMSRY